MMFNKLILVSFILAFLSGVYGHSYLTNPTSRSDQTQSNTGCRGPACLGPCDVPLNKARTPALNVQRGQSLNPQWPRNNHAGGFIRFAWAPTAQSDDRSVFNGNVAEIHCHEVGGCGPSNPSDPNGGDTNPADGSHGACSTNITVPLYLTNGLWTLQWAWFGGAFSLGDYYSCVDVKVTGGPSGVQQSAVFYGGDFSNPGKPVCKFFNTDRLGACVNEPCDNPVYPASQQQTGPAYGVQVASSGSTPVPVPVPPTPVTTKAVTPVTTGSKSSSTTGARPAQTTTGSKPAQITTGSKPAQTTTASRPAQITTGTSSSGSPSPNGNTQNCAGATTLSRSTASIASVDAWGASFRAVININVVEPVLTNWRLEIIWPSNAVNTQVHTTFNAGTLNCQSTTPVNHAIIAPVASWANNVHSGTVITIEVEATNTNMNSQFIMANTQFRVYTQ